ncbi:MAG TPA: glycosyltransferase family 4 protein [Vicinamibacterales bacterium]
MKILSITAGAAGMYCGSCFRDNALAAELMARGHDVHLIPVYTPTRTDEPNVSTRRVLFGGISVYLQQHVPLFRRLPRPLDRIWDMPAVISAFANRSVTTDPGLLGNLTISMLQGTRGVLRREFDKLLEWTRDEPAPDVINLPNSLLIAMAAPLREAFGRPVCCTLQGEELFVNGLPPTYREQALALMREQVPGVDRFIAVSEYCARFMEQFLAIPPGRLSVVPLGINMSGYERRADVEDAAAGGDAGAGFPPPPTASARHAEARFAREGGSRPFCIGYFARVAPEKGLHVLADAYVRFRRRAADVSARLDVAGYLAPAHERYLADARRTLSQAGFGDEFTYHGELDRDGKVAFLRGLDVLSVPATYDEPKGMFLLEAMASGVPVVQPRRGAFVEMVERTGGGVLVTPDDPQRLADALCDLWQDRATRRALGDRAFHGVRAHYTVAHSADRLIGVYRDVAARAQAVA